MYMYIIIWRFQTQCKPETESICLKNFHVFHQFQMFMNSWKQVVFL